MKDLFIKHIKNQLKMKSKIPQQEYIALDYRQYSFLWKERIRMLAEYAVLSGSFAYLFYRSWVIMAALWLFYPFYRKRKKNQMIKKRQDILCREFKDSIQCAAASMAAGYSIENAFREEIGRAHV